jgi:hypothetical protein
MFCVKEFADGTSVDRYSAFAADVTEGINTAATNVVRGLAGNNGVRQTFVTEKLSKQSLIKETGKKPIANDGLQFPLWIKVPLIPPLLAASFRRHFIRRLSPKKATDKDAKP